MPLLHLILVALIQGVTEFLPISSSGHLILLPRLTGMDDQGLAIDVAVHVGTLFAVIIYFWADVKMALIGFGRLLRGKKDTEGARLAFNLIIATIPVVIAGLIMKVLGIDEMLRSVAVIGWTMLIFGLVLFWADQSKSETLREERWTTKHAIIMGLWQVLALIPGTSRSGITITGARALGYERHAAAKLAMLMSIPVISASGILLAGDVVAAGDMALLRDGLFAAIFAFVSALGALWIMMRLLYSVSFTPYVIYRVFLGAFLLFIAYM